jgi:hypothetical protein
MQNAASPGQQQQQQQQELTTTSTTEVGEPPASSGKKDRRLSDEWGSFLQLSRNAIIRWICCHTAKFGESRDRTTNEIPDAAKVPPSRFQKRKGSIYATPGSRDGHVDKNYAEKYHAKIAEMKEGK